MLLSLALAAIMALSGNVGQAPYDLTVRVRPPHGVVCIQVWDKEVVGGEIAPVRQSCWVQDRRDPPLDSRTYILGNGDFLVTVSVDGHIIGSETVLVSEERPSNTPCRGQQCGG